MAGFRRSRDAATLARSRFAVTLGIAVQASAQSVRGVDIVEQGIYTADIERQVRGPDGLLRNVLSNICHVVDTTICRPGSVFTSASAIA